MYIDIDRCTGCGACVPHCPMEAIAAEGAGGPLAVDQDRCVECGTCARAGVCPTDALIAPPLSWPRVLRRRFSNPLVTHEDTGVPGRGTEEMKTNDVTGRLPHGHIGLVVELGRPGVGATFRDAEKVITALVGAGARIEDGNPLTHLIEDPQTGRLRPEVLGERILSAIVEVQVEEHRLARLLDALRAAADTVDTVFSVGLACRCAPTGEPTAMAIARAAGFTPSLNGKLNVGLGRPPTEGTAP